MPFLEGTKENLEKLLSKKEINGKTITNLPCKALLSELSMGK
jgi:hypothetical protein